jgi:alginate O-acetyltransferase complex protein AlgI
MLFNSYIFIFGFLPITLAIFFLLGVRKQNELAISWLFGASLFFYGWWNPAYLLLMLASMTGNFFMANLMSRCEQLSRRKALLVLVVGLNLSLLFYYKYANFFVDGILPLTGFKATLATIILPLGISFFTFTQIAYQVDVYRRIVHEYKIVHYFLFVTYFPHLIAGPILHHKEMMPQFKNQSIFSPSALNFSVGISIFIIGLFKKVVIADSVAEFASPVFDAADSRRLIHPGDAWGAALAYTLQLYFDFSGYSDMAIGISRMFGILLPLNFNSPYKAENIIDFWRRWHMTLSRFLRDYLYVGLGGNRLGKFNRYRNLFLTMLLGGIWHGAGWNFMIWGAIHGTYLMINHGWRALMSTYHGFVMPRAASRFLSILLTFIAVMFAWIFFRCETLHGALHFLQSMFYVIDSSSQEIIFPDRIVEGTSWRLMIFLLFVIWFLPNTQQIMHHHKPAIDYDASISPGTQRLLWQPTVKWALAIALLAGIALCSLSKVSEFLYFQF